MKGSLHKSNMKGVYKFQVSLNHTGHSKNVYCHLCFCGIYHRWWQKKEEKVNAGLHRKHFESSHMWETGGTEQEGKKK